MHNYENAISFRMAIDSGRFSYDANDYLRPTDPKIVYDLGEHTPEHINQSYIKSANYPHTDAIVVGGSHYFLIDLARVLNKRIEDYPLISNNNSMTTRSQGKIKQPTKHKFKKNYVYYDYFSKSEGVELQKWKYVENGKKTFGWIYNEYEEAWFNGLGGHTPYPYNIQIYFGGDDFKSIFITEGEKDCNTLHGFGVPVISMPHGAKNNWKTYVDYNICFENKTVIILVDNDEAGNAYQKAIYEGLSSVAKAFKIIDVPNEIGGKPVKDISDWVDNGLTRDQLVNIVQKSPIIKPMPIPLSVELQNLSKEILNDVDPTLKNQIKDILDLPKNELNMREKKERISKVISEYFWQNGRMINENNNNYWFSYKLKSIFQIDHRNPEYQYFLNIFFGINPSDRTLFEFITHDLKAQNMHKGEKVNLYDTVYYNSKNNIIYLFNNQSKVFRITQDDIDIVDNGTDKVLFKRNYLQDEIKADPSKQIDNQNELAKVFSIPNYSKDSSLANNELKQLLMLCFLSFFFPELMETKPILCIVGEKGSGKSLVLKIIKMLFYGRKSKNLFQISENQSDFQTYVTNNYLAFLDNMDDPVKGKLSWVQDSLAVVSTGISYSKRVLYTDNQQVVLTPRCFLAITSRTPHFRRDDVAERTIFIDLDKIEQAKPEKEIFDDIEQNKIQIWNEILFMLKTVLKDLSEHPSTNVNFRLADWASFCKRLPSVIDPNLVQIILDKLSIKQSKFTLEDDPIYQSLLIWIDSANPNPDIGEEKSTNEGRRILATELYTEIKTIAISNSIAGIPKNANPFAKRLKSMTTDLRRLMNVNVSKDRTGKHYYEFHLKQV